LEDGPPVASTALKDEAEEEGISFPTLRRAKKALRIQSHKRGEEWDWWLPGLRVIPQPTPLVSLASLDPLEHVQVHQTVSGGTDVGVAEPVTPEGGAAPAPCGCGYAHAPGDCGSEVIENMEDVQEGQEAQEGEELEETPTAFTPPRYCKRCHQRPTWINRGTYLQCSTHKCPGKVLVR
jgi:hypothetical protein